MNIYRTTDSKGKHFKILESTSESQIGVMTIGPGEDSGREEKHTGDQIIYIVEGVAEIELDGEKSDMTPGDAVVIPKGARHQVRNRGIESVFLITFYAPPQY